MARVTFGSPVLKVEGLEVKYDIVPVSSSLARLIGDKDSASIVQQLYYWLEQGYGEVIDGVRWIYKPIKEWIDEVFPTYTSYQLGKMMKQLSDRGIIRREKLFTKHQIQKGDRFWWQPKNQTYYYSLDTEKLQELADNFHLPQEKAETIETSVFIKNQILSDWEIEHTKDSDYSKNNTDITSIENSSKDQSHPHLPCVSNVKEKENSQEKQELNNLQVVQQEQVNSFDSTFIEQDTNISKVEQEINQNNSTNLDVVDESWVEVKGEREKGKGSSSTSNSDVPKPKLKQTPKGTKPNRQRRNQAPWKDEGQFKRFYRALIEALPIVANARSPQGLAQTIIRQLRSGIPHSYWDDFAAGLPIGTSTKPEWEVKPGIPHPMFIEYLAEKLIKGNNSQTREQAIAQALNIASSPKQAMFFWKECKISLGNALSEAERHRALGVKALPTPLWTKERREPTLAEAAIAGTKIQQINGSTQASIESAKNPQLEGESEPSTPDPWTNDAQPSLSMREMLAARGVKGFCTQRALDKPMPKVSREEAEAEAKAESEALKRQQMNYKTHINQMSLDEINELLKDSITRKELTPQIVTNEKFDVVTDNLGQILAVKINQQYLDLEET